jgi:hypothetical protein
MSALSRILSIHKVLAPSNPTEIVSPMPAESALLETLDGNLTGRPPLSGESQSTASEKDASEPPQGSWTQARQSQACVGPPAVQHDVSTEPGQRQLQLRE